MIFDVPATKPLTDPVVAPTDAIDALLLDHTPPALASDNNVVAVMQTAGVPVIGASDELTVTTTEREQPDGIVYTIVVVPAARAVTSPDEEPTVAIEVLVLDHVPPPEASANKVVKPMQADGVPVIGDIALTVITPVETQPAAVV